jgi:hypothetical protein
LKGKEKMKVLEAKVLSTVPMMQGRPGNNSTDREEVAGLKIWRMQVSYFGPESVYEVELREPLRGISFRPYTIGLNGHIEFEMVADPGLAAGEHIMIDAYEPGERFP